MALCRLCHWTFDEGLLGVSPRYAVPRSVGRQLAQSPNVAGHLLTLEGRSILGPGERSLWPDLDALASAIDYGSRGDVALREKANSGPLNST